MNQAPTPRKWFLNRIAKNGLVISVYNFFRKRIEYYFVYKKEYRKFSKLLSQKRGFAMEWEDRAPALGEKTTSLQFDTHYIYHPAWAARILAKTQPNIHVDISSTLFFAAIVSAYQKMQFYDYRPAPIQLDNLSSGQADLCNLSFDTGSIMSLSCMHTLEHVGLGRYGDPLDPNGDIKAAKELERVLANNGDLLIAVPMGKPRIAFNAHRVYSYDQVISLFPNLKLKEFSLIPDNALITGMTYNADKETANSQEYGCGCFWLKK